MPDLWPWGIAAACVAAAITATIKMVEAQSALKEEQKRVQLLEAEVARLKNSAGSQKQDVSDEFTKPLNYPKVHNA